MNRDRLTALVRVLLGIAVWLPVAPAAALPEIARYNHFTCTSCHVSPGGGGMVTPYGRDFAASKLSTWSRDFEENPIPLRSWLSDRYLFGGDIRLVDLRRETGDESFSKFWRMQTDLEAGIHYKRYWATYMLGTEPAGPTTEPEEAQEIKTRGFSGRADLMDDHLIVRAGLFMPKFGLMLSDHTAFVRIASGLGPDAEQTQAEVIYQNDRIEATGALLVQSSAFDRAEESKSGFNLGVSTFLRRSRFNLNLLSTTLSTETADFQTTSFSSSAVVTLTRRVYGMVEYDRVLSTISTEAVDRYANGLANYFSLHYEAYKGLIPYLRYEFWDTDIVPKNTSTQRWGSGVAWYPRPHLQVEGRFLRYIVNQTIATTNQTDIILHYYF